MCYAGSQFFWIFQLTVIWDKVVKNGQVKFVEDTLKIGNIKIILSSTNFTWSIFEYFVSFIVLIILQ